MPGKMEAGALEKRKACKKLQVLLISGSVPALGSGLGSHCGSSSGGTSIVEQAGLKCRGRSCHCVPCVSW